MSMFSLNANDSQQIGRRFSVDRWCSCDIGQDVWNTGLQGLSVLEVLQVRWLVQVLPEPESQQRTNRQRNGKYLCQHGKPCWFCCGCCDGYEK